jgi:hypothetical protein
MWIIFVGSNTGTLCENSTDRKPDKPLGTRQSYVFRGKGGRYTEKNKENNKVVAVETLPHLKFSAMTFSNLSNR